MIVASAHVLAFATSWLARHSQVHAVGSCVGCLTRLQSSLYATARWLARPTPTRAFTSELPSGSSPRPNVEYNYAGKQSIPATGLSPVRCAALWAAAGLTRLLRIVCVACHYWGLSYPEKSCQSCQYPFYFAGQLNDGNAHSFSYDNFKSRISN